MGIHNFTSSIDRKVWENKNGSYVTAVSGLLTPGEYTVKMNKMDDGSIVLKYIPKDGSE